MATSATKLQVAKISQLQNEYHLPSLLGMVLCSVPRDVIQEQRMMHNVSKHTSYCCSKQYPHFCRWIMGEDGSQKHHENHSEARPLSLMSTKATERPCCQSSNHSLIPWVEQLELSNLHGGFLKWWYPTTMGFPTKNDHFGGVLGVPPFKETPAWIPIIPQFSGWQAGKDEQHVNETTYDVVQVFEKIWRQFHHYVIFQKKNDQYSTVVQMFGNLFGGLHVYDIIWFIRYYILEPYSSPTMPRGMATNLRNLGYASNGEV